MRQIKVAGGRNEVEFLEARQAFCRAAPQTSVRSSPIWRAAHRKQSRYSHMDQSSYMDNDIATIETKIAEMQQNARLMQKKWHKRDIVTS